MITYFASDTNHETKREDWNQPENRSPSKYPKQTASLLPSKLPARAHLPSCAGTHNFAQFLSSHLFASHVFNGICCFLEPK